MTRKRKIYWLITAVIVLILFWLGFLHKCRPKEQAEKMVPVEVQQVDSNSIEETIEVTGTIKANSVVYLKSKVPGRLESLNTVGPDGGAVAVEEGLAVAKGQQIAVVDRQVYSAEVARAEAAVRAAEATLRSYRIELADAEREKKRISTLYTGGSVTEQSRDKAITAAESSAAKATGAEAQLAQARATMELAQINLRESNVVSPIDGIVTKKHIDRCNLINVGDTIVTIADMKNVKLVIGFAERHQLKIRAGLPARIQVDSFPEMVFLGKVHLVYPAVDERTRTIQVEIRLDNSELLLKPGMFARVTLVTDSRNDVVVIPRDVILGGRIDDRPYVYVIGSGIAHKRFVKIGIKQGERWQISEGLAPGETLVVNGMNYLTDGSKVRVVRMEAIE